MAAKYTRTVGPLVALVVVMVALQVVHMGQVGIQMNTAVAMAVTVVANTIETDDPFLIFSSFLISKFFFSDIIHSNCLILFFS